MSTQAFHKEKKTIEKLVIKFVGDSGDGMQLTGTEFANTSALIGNDISTFPNYPAEIRAPQGSVYGVSGFQVQIGHQEVSTAGDMVDVLVAMNPAAFKTNIDSLPEGKILIVDEDSFTAKNIEKAGCFPNALDHERLQKYRVIKAPITSLTKECLKELELGNKEVLRSKNMFALGMVFWLFNRPMEHTIHFIETKFNKNDVIAKANIMTLKAGYNYAETLELLPESYIVEPAKLPKGTYRIITGNQAIAWGFIAAASKVNLPLFLGSYPITPASDILHELSKHKALGVTTFQAEDEIAGVSAAIGAAFAGNLAITTTSGPGMALKTEAIGLALMTELPLVIINVQRGGPSTGLPTKTEQSDLLQAMYGRNGESPVIVLAASTSSNCYNWAYTAAKLAIEHMTPVVLLSDGYLANGSQPWLLHKLADMPSIKAPFAQANEKDFLPYERDETFLVRKWAIPGTKGLEHRIGGLEKAEHTGEVSYNPENHQRMCEIRAEKIARVALEIPDIVVEGNQDAETLIIGWGGTYGSIHTAVKMSNAQNKAVAHIHFNYINPMPKNTAEILKRYKKIIVAELNLGQLIKLLRDRYPENSYIPYHKIQGLPFTVEELIRLF